jgi:DNA-directed RNA polymerase subunit RPC12/RpoP
MAQTRDQTKGHKRDLRLVRIDESSPFVGYCAAMFGTPHQGLRPEFFQQEVQFNGTLIDLISLAIEIVKEWQQTWLDVTGHELNPSIGGWWWSWAEWPPTVVLVQDRILDLSYFWNIRTASDTFRPAWVIPIPIDECKNPEVVTKVKEWVLTFLQYGRKPNYCNVTSVAASEPACREFAALLQSALAGSPIENVDYEPPRNHLPEVVPYEYEAVWTVETNGQKLSFLPPRPKAFAEMGNPRGWFVDILKDVKTGRALKNLRLPSGPVASDLLNGPCPPSCEHARVKRAGDGADSINIRCSGNEGLINVHLPSGEEVLEETLWDHGVEPIHDEKRSSYLPVIRRFGGLYLAGAAFAGNSGAILMALEKGPMAVGEIRGKCKLGDGTLAGKSYMDRIDQMLESESERIKRIGRRRYAHFSRNHSPENLKLDSVLEYWTERSVLTRQWRIGPCPKCKRTSFVEQLNLRKRIACPACGNRISLRSTVPIGYELDRTVKLAVREGIAPIVLTGRFLEQMTNSGFFYLPGVKYKIGDQSGDIDLLACCDGHLVFCECKRLENTPSGTAVWDEVVAQFIQTAEVAKRCGGSVAILAVHGVDFPQEVKDRLAKEIGTNIPYELLTKQDLETGYRNIMDMGHPRPMKIHDLIPMPFPERPQKRAPGRRTVDFGAGVYFEG